MSDETYPESPTESGKSTGDKESPDSDPSSGYDAGSPSGDASTDGTAAPLSSDRQENEDDFEITFFATLDTAQGERIVWPDSADSAPPPDEVTILLPAWSATTVSRRGPAVPPPVQSETTRKWSLWSGCFVAAIAAVVIFSLLGSSLFSLFWFLTMRGERIAEVSSMLDAHSGQPPAESSGQNPLGYDEEGEGAQLPALAAASFDPVNRIVFINDNRHVETMNPDGSERRQLTSDARSYLFPAWSLDGRFVAAIGSAIDGAGIYVMPDEQESSAKEEVHFSNQESPFYLYWSPDGQQITFLANDGTTGLSLNVIDLVGDSSSRTVATGTPLYWNWTADSRQMLVHSGTGASDSQLVMIDDFGRPQAPQIPAPGPFQAPGISASGRYWAYSQFQSGGTTWLVIDDRYSSADNSRRHAGSVAFNWSPTADEVAFISGSNENEFGAWGPLRLMDAQTGAIRLLSSDTVLAFFWSPDGRKIVTISVPEQNDLGQQFEVRGEKGRRLARYDSDRSTLPAAQMAPHSFIVNVIDVQSGEGRQLIETGFSAIFLTQFIPYFDQYAFSHQIWSPDGNTLVLPLAEGRQSRITLVDTRNGRTTPLAEGSIGFWSRQ